MAVKLEDLVRGQGAMSPRQLKQVREWVSDNWEACDHDRNLVALVRRLLATCTNIDRHLNKLASLLKEPKKEE